MAREKISELTAAATLDGSEQIPVVQSGATVRTTVADLPAGGVAVVVAASGASSKSKAAADYTCDGTDDHAEINTAIGDVTAAGGGTVWLTEGEFHPSASIELETGVHLRGQGREATLLTLANTSDVDVITNADRGSAEAGVSDIAVSSLTVDGNAADQDQSEEVYTGEHYYLACIRLANVDGGFVFDVAAHNATGYGIEVKRSQHVDVWRCEAYDNGDDGISITDAFSGSAVTDDVHVFRCEAHDNGKSWHLTNSGRTGSGIEVDDGPTNVVVERCVMHTNGGAGFDTHTHSGEVRPSRITLSGCLIYGNSTENDLWSAGLRQVDDVLVDNCWVDADRHIQVDDATDVTIVGGRFTSLITTDAVNAETGFSGLIVADCLVDGDPLESSDVTDDGASSYTLRRYDQTGSGGGGETFTRGTATVTSSDTSVDVPHGLDSAPDPGEIQVVATNGEAAAADWWVDALTSSTFTINVDSSPASDATFAWLHTPADAADVAAYDEEVMADSPLAYWRFEETSGTTATDETANSHDGTWNGSPTLGATGKVGNAVTLDGSDDYMDPGNLGDFGSDCAAAFTIEFWFKFTTTDQETVFTGWNGNSGETLLHIHLNTSGNSVGGQSPGRIAASLRNDSGDQTIRATDRSDLNDGNWHHIAVVWDDSDTTIDIYVDGILDNGASDVDGSAITSGSTSNFTVTAVGRKEYSSDQHVDGTLDEMALYTSAVSGSRISAHYDAA